MIAATVTPPTSGATSLRDLINEATQQLNPLYTGRVFGINIQWVSGTVNVYFRGDPGASEDGHLLDSTNRSLLLGHKSHLNLSLDEVFLGGSASPSARVAAWPSAYGSDLFAPPPIPLAGLALWLKADAIVGFVDNDPLTSWVDSSGAGNTATATNNPTYKTGILNSLPVVRFDATNDGMTTPNNVFGSNPNSFFIVYNCTTNSGSHRAIQSVSGNWLMGPWGGQDRVFNGGGFIQDAGIVIGDFTYATAITTAGGTTTFWTDGVSNGSLGGAVGPGRIALGAGGAFAEALSGDIAEIIGYTTDMTAQRTAIEAYLVAKYAL